ncbi:MAG: hypothetical protein AAF329_10125 [Cyanobacteria bacterium P01_A01_bin.17]
MASDSPQSSDSSEKGFAIAARRFLAGVFLSSVPIFAYLELSTNMTYGSWASVGMGQWVGAILVPLLCGVLSAALGRKVIDVLSAIVEGVQLPF